MSNRNKTTKVDITEQISNYVDHDNIMLKIFFWFHEIVPANSISQAHTFKYQ